MRAVRRQPIRVLAAALALLVLGGLGAGALAAPARPGDRIAYAATGGIAGIDDRLVVGASGRAVLTLRGRPDRTRTYRRTLSRAANRRLRRLVTAAGIERLRARYAPATPVADGIDRSLTFHGRTVTVAQGATPPKALARAIGALADLSSTLQQRQARRSDSGRIGTHLNL